MRAHSVSLLVSVLVPAQLALAACQVGDAADTEAAVQEKDASPGVAQLGVASYRVQRLDSGAEVQLLSPGGAAVGRMDSVIDDESTQVSLELDGYPAVRLALSSGRIEFAVGDQSGAVGIEDGDPVGDPAATSLFRSLEPDIDRAMSIAIDSGAIQQDGDAPAADGVIYSGQCFGFGTSSWSVSDACVNAVWDAMRSCGWHFYHGSSVINSGGPGPTLYFCSVFVYYY